MSMTSHTFVVPDASCDHCVKTISNALLGVDGVYKVDVDLDSKDVTVDHDIVVNTGALREAIENAGYHISGENTHPASKS